MTLNDHDRAELLRALNELGAGRDNIFEDRLWLHFGDDWTLIREHLAVGRYVKYPKKGDHPITLTDQGKALVAQLTQATGAAG